MTHGRHTLAPRHPRLATLADTTHAATQHATNWARERREQIETWLLGTLTAIGAISVWIGLGL